MLYDCMIYKGGNTRDLLYIYIYIIFHRTPESSSTFVQVPPFDLSVPMRCLMVRDSSYSQAFRPGGPQSPNVRQGCVDRAAEINMKEYPRGLSKATQSNKGHIIQ